MERLPGCESLSGFATEKPVYWLPWCINFSGGMAVISGVASSPEVFSAGNKSALVVTVATAEPWPGVDRRESDPGSHTPGFAAVAKLDKPEQQLRLPAGS
jgi:hypothetical protein